MKKQIILCIVGILFVVGAVVNNRISVAPLETKYEKLSAEYYEKQNEYESKSDILNLQADAVKNSVTAVSSDKVKEDTKSVKKVLKSAFNFDTENVFENNKNALINQSEDMSKFVKTVMPSTQFKDAENPLRELNKVTLYPVKISGGTYVYRGVVDYYMYKDKSDLDQKDTLPIGRCYFNVVCDNKHKVSDLVANSMYENDAINSVNKKEV